MSANDEQQPRFPASAVGQALGEEVSFLGRGTFGDTWRAGSSAVKVICVDNYPEARLRREVEGLSRVTSPYVVKLLETFSMALGGSARPAMRFEFIEGGDLAERISHGNWPTASNAEALLEGLLRGVAALHEAKTIHRDIKPGNIALRDGDWSRPVLLDLGLAKQMDGSTITAYPGLIGTYFYMAPEQLRGERAKKAADLWAVGVTVRELIDQRHPFYSADNPPHSIDEALQAIANGPTPLPDDIEGGAREVLERLTSTREYDRGSTGSNLRRLQETRRAI